MRRIGCLLIVGSLLIGACDGDVQIAPMRDPFGEQVLQLRLASPDGVAVLEASADAVLDFLARSYGRVPPGHESDHMDIDAAVDALLAG